MNTKINKITYLFPLSIFLVIRQSFDLAMLATNMCLVAEWNLMPTVRGYVYGGRELPLKILQFFKDLIKNKRKNKSKLKVKWTWL